MKPTRRNIGIGVALLGVFAVGAIVGCGEDSGKSKKTAQTSPTVPLATKKSFTQCLAKANVQVGPGDPKRHPSFFPIDADYLTVPFAGGSYADVWVYTGSNQLNPLKRPAEAAFSNSDPTLSPGESANYSWDHTRNILFALPTDPPLQSGDPAGAAFDQCLRTA
jgi:hypothetical protein